MGNCRFKFSDMIPNSWFYKLKYTSRTRNQKSMQKPTKKKNQPNTKSSPSSSSSSQSSLSPSSATPAPPQPHHLSHQRKSYHFTRDLKTPHPPSPDNNSASQFSDPPRQSSKKRRSIKKNRPSNRASPRQLVTSSVSADCSCRASLESVWTKPESTPVEYPLDSCSSEDDDSMFPELGSENENGEQPFDKMVSWSNSCHCRVKGDILIDMSNNANFKKLGGFDSNSQFELPPIITKTDKSEKNEAAARIKTEERNSYIISSTCSKEQRITSPVRKLTVNNSPGVKLRTNSPRLARNRFLQVNGRKSLSSGGGGTRRSLAESFAVVKSSQDPHRDFKESMVEMIMENNMRTSKDLEDLLACYLSLNSDKYHDLIIKVFKQIWLEIIDIRLK